MAQVSDVSPDGDVDPGAGGAVCGHGGDARLYAVDYIYGVVDDVVLTEMQSGNRHISIGLGIPSEPVFYFNAATKKAKLMIQKSDTDVEDPEGLVAFMATTEDRVPAGTGAGEPSEAPVLIREQGPGSGNFVNIL